MILETKMLINHRGILALQKVGLNYSSNGRACFKNASKCLNTNIYPYLDMSGGQSSDPYLNIVHFFNTSVN
jgi:hypothetical protein